MSKGRPESSTLTYATPSAPTQNSAYAIASLAVAGLFLLWQWSSIIAGRSFLFDDYKESRIFAAGGFLAVILAVASYLHRFRRRSLSHVAIGVAVVAFLSAILIVPL